MFRPLLSTSLAFLLCIPALQAGGLPGTENPTGALSLRAALRLTLLQNPELAATQTEIRAAEGRLLQSSLRPNPALDVTAENVLGSGPYRGLRATETTLQLNQLVEVGGKRAARVAVANLGRQLAGFDFEAKRLELFSRTTTLFVQVVAAQRRLELARETRQLTEGVIPAIERRIEAGAANPVEVTRARTAAATVRIEEAQAERDLAQARGRLAASWGAVTPTFSVAQGELESLPPLPSLDSLKTRAGSTPALARFNSEIDRRQAELTLAKAVAVPDPTFGIGYRRFSETGDGAAVFQFQLALPVANQNQGAIREARANLIKTAQLREAAVVGVSTRVNDAYRTAQAARREIDLLRGQVLPGAEEAFRLIDQGYLAGRFSQLDLIDARRTLVTARGALLLAQSAYHQALAEITGLSGPSPGGSPERSLSPSSNKTSLRTK
ncbi:MAG: TolC family protein [Verrucomicrobia bacterium]|nr:TolC family protein [Verrucomicrobiota bacterium]